MTRSRCRSWRPNPDSKHPAHAGHLPGECRSCWTPCRARVDDGNVRCGECEFLLAEHPAVKVRRALVSEPSLRTDVVEFLASDSDAIVSQAARWYLDHHGGGHGQQGRLAGTATLAPPFAT